MSPSLLVLGPALSLLIVLGGWLHYLRLIPQERVPERPVAHMGVLGVGALLAVMSTIPGVTTGSLAVGLAALVLGAIAVGGALYFPILLSQAPLPDGALVVSVGDPLPDFEAPDATGAVHRSADWRGSRVLLKFFRGHW
ncbi:MAG: hypothetical protein H6739_40475 [Alphaproteobacteria bacterium]|nr:hypothetical protein [Alphaproteobacteria bacterium]